MKYLKITLSGLVVILVALLFIIPLDVTVAQGEGSYRAGNLYTDPEGREEIQASAQSSGDYDLAWWTVDGGGATFNTNGGYSLGSSIGQPDAAVWSGGDYTLAGGFWGGTVVDYRIYLPLVLKG